MKAFFDGSGTKESEFLILVGVAADDSAWAGFDQGWKEVLANRDPRPKYLHMTDLASLNEHFSSDKGWTDEKAAKLIIDCLMYAQHLDKNKFKVFNCCVEMKAFRKVRASQRLPSCYQLCSVFSAEPVLTWYLDRFSGKGFSNHWHLIKSVTTVCQQDAPPIQLADLCAWSRNRRLMADRYGSQNYQHIGPISEKIFPFRRKVVDEGFLSVLATYGPHFPPEKIAGFDWK